MKKKLQQAVLKVATSKPPHLRPDTPTIELGEEMVVTDQELDRIYGTDRPHSAPTSIVDEERNDMRENGSWYEDDETVEALPTSLMNANDFHDDTDNPPPDTVEKVPNWNNETKTLPGRRPRAVSRSRRSQGGGMLIKIMVPFWVLVMASMFFIYGAKIQPSWTLGQDFAKTFEELAGLPPPPGDGLAIHKGIPRREVRGGVDYIIFEGQIENISLATVPLPPMYLELLDGRGNLIHGQTQTFAQNTLAPGKTVPYNIVVENPSSMARTANLRFLAETETMKILGPPHDR